MKVPGGGYRWGQHGTIYRTRTEAMRQGRAIYAAGYQSKKAKK